MSRTKLLVSSIIIWLNSYACFGEIVKARKFILSVGIDKFDDKLFQNLKYASKDSEDLKAIGEKFDFKVIHLSSHVTKEDILIHLNHLSAINKFEDDTVIIYFSTHGTRDFSKNGIETKYIVTSDSKSNNLEKTAIDFKRLLEIFEKLESRKKALILATCYSGTGKSAFSDRYKKLSQDAKGNLEEDFVFESDGAMIFSASKPDQKAREDDDLKNDIYSHFLFKSIKSGFNKHGWASLAQSHQKSTELVYKYTKKMQMPSMNGYLSGNDAIVFGSTKNYEATLLKGSIEKDIDSVSIDGSNRSFKKGLIHIAPGFHKVSVKSSEKDFSRKINFKSGHEYFLDNISVPFYKHNFTLGVGNLLYSNAHISNPVRGISLTYRHDEFINDISLEIDISKYGTLNENTSVKGIDSFQSRDVRNISIIGGHSKKLSLLSKNDGTLDTVFRYGIGVSNSSIEINRTNEAFYVNKLSANIFGVTNKIEIAVQTHHSINFGLGNKMSIFNSPFANDKTIMAWEPYFYTGVFW